MLIAFVARALATCPTDTADQVESLAREVEQAFDRVDDAGFQEAYRGLGEAIPCVRSALDPEALVAWHRARALGEFWERELVASSKSWAAVRQLDPSYRPKEAWMPAGSPLRDAFQHAPMEAERVQLERVPEGGWLVDGQPTRSVPATRAFVLQGFDAAGELVHTDYHYSVAEVPVVDFEALDPTARQLRQRRMHLGGTVLAGVLLGSAGSFLVLAGGDRKRVDDRSTPLGEIAGFADRAGRRSTTAVVLGAGGLAVAGTTWAVRW